MGAALFITLRREIPDFDAFVNGKALSEAERKLERIANELSVTPLMDFFSQDAGAAADFIEAEGGDPDDIELPDEAWFDAADGLSTVNALLEHISNNADVVRDSTAVLSDLREFQTVLKRAADENVEWHLEVDF